mmetsp:Transcript_46418/g.109023  ORF Transcript_46418/g.109023 Transcript_46418/m.109023 type:complete len:283 (-) Transcript_46418:2211-3059(-)
MHPLPPKHLRRVGRRDQRRPVHLLPLLFGDDQRRPQQPRGLPVPLVQVPCMVSDHGAGSPVCYVPCWCKTAWRRLRIPQQLVPGYGRSCRRLGGWRGRSVHACQLPGGHVSGEFHRRNLVWSLQPRRSAVSRMPLANAVHHEPEHRLLPAVPAWTEVLWKCHDFPRCSRLFVGARRRSVGPDQLPVWVLCIQRHRAPRVQAVWLGRGVHGPGVCFVHQLQRRHVQAHGVHDALHGVPGQHLRHRLRRNLGCFVPGVPAQLLHRQPRHVLGRQLHLRSSDVQS